MCRDMPLMFNADNIVLIALYLQLSFSLYIILDYYIVLCSKKVGKAENFKLPSNR